MELERAVVEFSFSLSDGTPNSMYFLRSLSILETSPSFNRIVTEQNKAKLTVQFYKTEANLEKKLTMT